MNKPIKFVYKFTLHDGTVKRFDIVLDPVTLALRVPKRDSYPDWTRLSHQQCDACPLKEDEHPRCPVAVGLIDILESFKSSISSDSVDLVIETEARTYVKKTPLSTGVSALIGLVMATSGCPLFDKLKPMVRTHLPFPSLQESMYRFLAMYMLAQYFHVKRGREPDWKMEGMVKLLDELGEANRKFCKRLYGICEKDANLNAIVHLDCFADNTAFFLKRKGLDEVEKTFHAHFDEPAG